MGHNVVVTDNGRILLKHRIIRPKQHKIKHLPQEVVKLNEQHDERKVCLDSKSEILKIGKTKQSQSRIKYKSPMAYAYCKQRNRRKESKHAVIAKKALNGCNSDMCASKKLLFRGH